MIPPLEALDLRSIIDSEEALPEPDYVLPGLLAGSVGLLAAPGGTGKTFFALSLAVSVCLGTTESPFLPETWRMRSASCGAVSFLAAEDPPDILKMRLHSWLNHLRERGWGKLSYETLSCELEARLHIFALYGETPDIVLQAEAHNNRSDAWLEQLEKAAEKHRLLILDPLRRFHLGDENDSGTMTRLIQVIEGIARRTGCSVLLTHHSNKAAIWAGRGAEQQAARGSSALTDAIRWQCNLSAMTKDQAEKLRIPDEDRKRHVWCDVPKSNYGPPLPGAWYYRTDVGLLLPEASNPKSHGGDSSVCKSRRKSY